MNQINVNNLIENAKTGDEAAIFLLNIVCKSEIRKEAKTNPKPLPAPTQSFDFRDRAGLKKWEKWTGHKVKENKTK